MGRSPAARFHHSLTMVPRSSTTGDLSHDFLVLLGGHDRTIEPLLDLHVLTLRDASFDWDDSDDSPRVAAIASWVAQPRDPEPPPRGFHAAVHWMTPWEGSEFIIVCCGMGPGYAALGDTWLYCLGASSWVELAATLPQGFERSRPALTVVGHMLLLSGGCHTAEAGAHTPLARRMGARLEHLCAPSPCTRVGAW